MGAWQRILALLRREQQGVGEALDDLRARASAALDERERDLEATPSEKLERELERSAEIDAELDAVRRRLEEGGPGPA